MGILVSLAARTAYPVQVAIVIVIVVLALVRLVKYADFVATLADRWIREVSGHERTKRLLAVVAIVEYPALLVAIATTDGLVQIGLALLLAAGLTISGACDLVAMIVRAVRPLRAVVR